MTGRYSKLMKAISMPRVTATLVDTAVWKLWIGTCEILITIIADNGPQFVLKIFATLWDLHVLKLVTTTWYHPQNVRQVERFNKVLNARLRHYIRWPLDRFRSVSTTANQQLHHLSTLEKKKFQFNLLLSWTPLGWLTSSIPSSY